MGPARDWDVFLDEIITPVAEAFEFDDDILHMIKRAHERQDKAYDDVTQMIKSPEYAQLLTEAVVWLGVGDWQTPQDGKGKKISSPARKVAKDVLQHRHKNLISAGKGLKKQTTGQRHQLRIAIKKARYGASFFADLYPGKQTHRYIQALKALQENLGHLNDLATAVHLIDDLIAAEHGPDVRTLSRAAGKVEGWFLHAQTSCESDLRAAWKQFKKAKPFWS